MKVDYLIVGSGLTGSVIARQLADANREVLIVERRSHIGGNVHDHTHPSGIRVHTYGPHYFRTSSEKILNFVSRFSEFFLYEACVKSALGNSVENWPISAKYIEKNIGREWKPAFSGTVTNFEEAALSLMPEEIYDDFVKEYNEKQWGIPARHLAASLCRRFDIRSDNDPRLTPKAKFQGIPVDGYATMMSNLLEKIPVLLNCDYLQQKNTITARKLTVFTGPIDEFFGFDCGRLDYRGQIRSHSYLSDISGYLQPCGQVNNPLHSGGPHIRTLEWKHMMPPEFARKIQGTIITQEVPFSPKDPGDYEYPVPDKSNAKRYNKYRARADRLQDVLICGRLGEYRYYDMDQAIARAMIHVRKILN